jgi:hypothetical protein
MDCAPDGNSGIRDALTITTSPGAWNPLKNSGDRG